jgi:hypothetical protein
MKSRLRNYAGGLGAWSENLSTDCAKAALGRLFTGAKPVDSSGYPYNHYQADAQDNNPANTAAA